MNKKVMEPTFCGKYSLWQLKDGYKDNHILRFNSFERLSCMGYKIDKNNYRNVYIGYKTAQTSLDELYEEFNISHPKNYKSRSLSVSDIITIKGRAYYVDSIGFVDVTENFFGFKSMKKEEFLKQHITLWDYIKHVICDYLNGKLIVEDEDFDINNIKEMAICQMERDGFFPDLSPKEMSVIKLYGCFACFHAIQTSNNTEYFCRNCPLMWGTEDQSSKAFFCEQQGSPYKRLIELIDMPFTETEELKKELEDCCKKIANLPINSKAF